MKFFKGKAINYHTEITTTKTEQTIIWITTLLVFAWFFISFLLIKSILLIILSDFIAFIILFAICILIIFNPKHIEERNSNAKITKI